MFRAGVGRGRGYPGIRPRPLCESDCDLETVLKRADVLWQPRDNSGSVTNIAD